MPTITLQPPLSPGDQLSPTRLHNLVDNAVISGFTASEIGVASSGYSIGAPRPTLALGRLHYDTTSGLEGLYAAFLSASSASVSGWLCATPRRECYCWAASSVSLGTPVFIGKPAPVGPQYTLYDGHVFPNVWMYTGASGPDAAFFITLESVTANKPVKCMWAGLTPPTLNLLNSSSGASIASPLFVNYASPAQLNSGVPSALNFIFGVALGNDPTGRSGLVWGGGPAIERIS